MTLTRTMQGMEQKRPVNVVFYGDSISEVKPGWNGGASAPEKNWGALTVARLGEAFPEAEFRAHHFSIGGQNTYEGLGRLDAVAAFAPDLVFVAFGANDCGWHPLMPEETGLALKTLVADIRARFGADVIVVGTAGDNPLDTRFRHVDETIAAQRTVAQETRAPFVDMRSAILAATDNGARWTEFHHGTDNCHPTDPGHEVWAAAAVSVCVRHVGQVF